MFPGFFLHTQGFTDIFVFGNLPHKDKEQLAEDKMQFSY
jgi:hypothetical protein